MLSLTLGFRKISFSLGAALLLLCLPGSGQPVNLPRIRQAINEEQLQTLTGNVHPLAIQRFNQGTAAADLPMERMLLVLKRSPEQQQALDHLMDQLHNPHAARFHQWLTPEQVGQQFGASEADLEAVTAWLQSHGFQVARVSKGRTVIEFSGTAGQVQEAFHTAVHKFVVNGAEHWANASDPQIPAALTPVVAGVATLHNFTKKPQHSVMASHVEAVIGQAGAAPEFTASSGFHALSPRDYYTIYNIYPLLDNLNIAGSGTAIAVVGRTNINVADITSFRSLFGLAKNDPQIVLNGPDPGNLGDGEEAEAVLDTSWAGAVAPQSTIKLVVSQTTNATDGVDLSEEYIIDNNLADVMTESFGDCEANFTSAQAEFYSNLAAQAAMQGITYTVASGDSGAAGCDSPDQPVATGPISVNLLASNPYVVAVGGTQLNENGNDSAYWNSTNFNGSSAYSYIPEVAWNESCSVAQCGSSNAALWAGGGGASSYYSKPSWQMGISGIPADGARDVPDVSLTAAGHDPYLLCINNSCTPDSRGWIYFQGYAGTSAATPSFAGLMALVVQSTGTRQGQVDYVLYKTAAAQNFVQCNASGTISLASRPYCTFNDVTVGNNAVPGQANYGMITAQYQAGVGYDLATGLGSVNAYLLIAGWNRSPEYIGQSYPPLTLSAANIDFGSVNAGQVVTQTLTLTNTGAATLALVNPLAGASHGFSWMSDCSASLAVGASCSLQVTFTPTFVGTFNTAISVDNSGSSYPHTVSLTGSVVATSILATSPAAYNFGAQKLLSRSAVQTIQISNPTPQAIALSSIQVTGNNAADFTIANNCGSSFAAGNTCSVYVVFSPQLAGTRFASITISDSDQGWEQVIPLTGTGVITGAFEIMNAASGKVLEPEGGSGANGAIIRQNGLSGSARQQWRLTPTGDGYYSITNVLTGKGLDVTNLSSVNGTPMQQYDYLGFSNQQWQLVMADDAHYRIVSRYSGKALEIPAAFTANQTALQQWDANGNTQQLWSLTPVQSYAIVNSNSNQTLDLGNRSADNGTAIQQNELTGIKEQQWQLVPAGGGYYSIFNRLTGKVLDLTGDSFSNGAPIQEYDYYGFANQQWQLVLVDAAHYQIKSRPSGKVLDVTGYSTARGATVQQWDYLGGANQLWQLTPVVLYNIVNRNSGQVLDIPNGSAANGTQLQQWNANGDQQQWWQLMPTDNGYYAIVNDLTDKALDVTGASNTDGTLIQQYDYLGFGNQQWQFVPVDAGYYKIVSRYSGKVLDVVGLSTASGALVQQYDYLGFPNQQWSLQPVTN